MLKELTKIYVKAFNDRNLNEVAQLLTDDFALEDPIVKRIEGKKNVLIAIDGIFNSCNSLAFEAKNIYEDSKTTIIEFILNIDGTILSGTDIIEWEDENMKELRAYLDIPCGESQ